MSQITVAIIEEYVNRAKAYDVDMELLRTSVKESGWLIILDSVEYKLGNLYSVFIALTYKDGTSPSKPKPMAF